MNMLKNKLKEIMFGFGVSMESANQEMFSQNHSIDSNNISYIKEQGGTLSQSLIKGEITQEVINLRYRMYKILDKLDQNQQVTFNKDGDFVGFIDKKMPSSLYKGNGDELILLQNEYKISQTLIDTFETIDRYEQHNDNLFKIQYNCMCKHKLEEFVEKLVIIKNNKQHYVDLYFTTYPDVINRLKRILSNEISKLYKKMIYRSDITEVNKISFITNNAIGSIDYIEYVLSINEFIKVIEHDGFYILRFSCQLNKGDNLSSKYYSETLDNLYNTKAKKNNTLITKKFNSQKENYSCEQCGKDMNNNLENADWILIKETIGEGLCLECYTKKLK